MKTTTMERKAWALTGISAALLMSYGRPAQALEFDTEGGWKGSFNTTLSVGASWRAEAPDTALYSQADGIRAGYGAGGTGGSNTDSSTLNWDKGDRFATPLKAVVDFSMRKNELGVFARAKAWYDQALKDENGRAGNADSNYASGQPLSDASQPRLNKYDGVELLDAYVYDTFDAAGERLQIRAGKQVVNWGESLFVQGVNQLNPIDLPALSKPGTEIKEALLPVWSLSANLGLGGGASLEAFYQFKWEAHNIDQCGGYWSPIEFGFSTSPGGGCRSATTTFPPVSNFDATNGPLFGAGGANGLYVPLSQGKDGKDSDQWGLAFRAPVAALDTELGAYAMRINSRAPIVSARTGTPLVGDPSGFINPIAVHELATGGALKSETAFWTYPDKIDIFGLSASTNLAGWSVGAELSYTPKQPVQINGNDLLFGLTFGIGPMGATAIERTAQGPGTELRGYDLIKKTQLQFNTIRMLPAVFGAAQGLLIAEVAAQHNDLPDNGRRYGRGFIFGFASDATVPAGGSTCANPIATLVNPQADGCKNDGFVTKNAWGYRIKASLDYPDLVGGFTFTPSLFWSHDVDGYSSDSQMVEDRQVLTVGMKFDYQKKYALDFGYTSFANKAKYDMFRDRDYYSASLSVTF